MCQSIRYTCALFGDAITAVTLYNEPPIGSLFVFLSMLGQFWPNIRALHLNFPLPRSLIPVADQLILDLNLHLLESLKLDRLGGSTHLVSHLSKLPHIKEMSKVEVPDVDLPQIRQLFNATNGRFPALRVLNLTATSYEHATAAICSLQRRLDSFSLIVSSENTIFASLVTFLQTFLHHQCSSSVTTVTLSEPRERIDFGESTDSRCVPIAFAPLFSLKQLRRICLESSCITAFDDSWLAEAATAWPNLESIVLDQLSSHPPKMTLAGYIPLLKHCPRLHQITIPTFAKPFDPQLLEKNSPNMEVENLFFARSPIVDPSGVHECLALMFPNLRSLDFLGDAAMFKSWMIVQRMLSNSSKESNGTF
ncbi:hypothetical protein DXG01_014338 [Tephrocybe rancida]|nr:hypothetical protein DXG01_014338 [Tephrocybe rancida]